MTKFGVSLLAALTVLAQIAIVSLLVGLVASALSARARRFLAGVFAGIGRAGVWMAWGAATVATLGSLFLSEVAHYVPCHLCWLQRYFMYPLVAALLVVALVRRWWVTLAAIVIPVIGVGISARHVWVENHPASASAQCKRGVPCSFKWVDEFGYVTIPLMAGTAFTLIILLLAIAGGRQLRARRPTGVGVEPSPPQGASG